MAHMMEREKWFQKVNYVVIGIYVVLVIWAFVRMMQHNMYQYLQAAAAVALLFVPFLIHRFSHIKVTKDFAMVFYLFCLFSVVIGSLCHGYSSIPLWDKILHLASGIIITPFGWIVCREVAGKETEIPAKLVGTFAFFFNVALAAIWELYEYGLYAFLKVDALNMRTTMAHDTLQDILACFTGGILISLYTYFKRKRGFETFFVNLYHHFIQSNFGENKK